MSIVDYEEGLNSRLDCIYEDCHTFSMKPLPTLRNPEPPKGKSRLWEALSPVAARMPRVVREFEILRVSATLFGKDSADSAETARRQALLLVATQSTRRQCRL